MIPVYNMLRAGRCVCVERTLLADYDWWRMDFPAVVCAAALSTDCCWCAQRSQQCHRFIRFLGLAVLTLRCYINVNWQPGTTLRPSYSLLYQMYIPGIYIPGTRYWNTIITAIIILSTYVWVLHYCHVRSTTHKVYDTMIDRRDLAYEYSCYYEILILILLIRTGIK